MSMRNEAGVGRWLLVYLLVAVYFGGLHGHIVNNGPVAMWIVLGVLIAAFFVLSYRRKKTDL